MARILIIDDNEVFRESLADYLRCIGHDAITAREGREGLRKFRASPAELVITDIIMPGQEGIQTIAEFRRAFPQVRIIAISGESAHSPFYLKLAAAAGAWRTISKPFTADEILSLVNDALADGAS